MVGVLTPVPQKSSSANLIPRDPGCWIWMKRNSPGQITCVQFCRQTPTPILGGHRIVVPSESVGTIKAYFQLLLNLLHFTVRVCLCLQCQAPDLIP